MSKRAKPARHPWEENIFLFENRFSGSRLHFLLRTDGDECCFRFPFLHYVEMEAAEFVFAASSLGTFRHRVLLAKALSQADGEAQEMVPGPFFSLDSGTN